MITLEDNQPCQIVVRKLAHLHRLRREIRQLKSKASTIIAQEHQDRIDATSVLPREMSHTHRINEHLSMKLKAGLVLFSVNTDACLITCKHSSFSQIDCNEFCYWNRAYSTWKKNRKFAAKGSTTCRSWKTFENSETRVGVNPAAPLGHDGARTFAAAAGEHFPKHRGHGILPFTNYLYRKNQHYNASVFKG